MNVLPRVRRLQVAGHPNIPITGEQADRKTAVKSCKALKAALKLRLWQVDAQEQQQ